MAKEKMPFELARPDANTPVTNASEIDYADIPLECGLVYDISVAHAVNNVLAQYVSLSAALGTNGENIPQDVRRGGMAVKFISSGTGKYEQWVLKSRSFSTTESDWMSVTNVNAENMSYGNSNVKVTLDGLTDDVDNVKDALDMTPSETSVSLQFDNVNNKYMQVDGSVGTNGGYRIASFIVTGLSKLRIQRNEAYKSISGIQYGIYTGTYSSPDYIASTLITSEKCALLSDVDTVARTIDDIIINPVTEGSATLLVQYKKDGVVPTVSSIVGTNAISTLNSKIGDLSELHTQDKQSLVDAINELATEDEDTDTINADDVTYTESENHPDASVGAIISDYNQHLKNIGTSDVTSSIYLTEVGNYYISSNGSPLSTGGGGGVQIFNVEDIQGKNIRITRANAGSSRSLQYAFYNINSTVFTNYTASDVVGELPTEKADNALDTIVEIPDDALRLVVYGRAVQYPATITLIINEFKEFSSVNPQKKPTYDGWSSGGNVSPNEYDNFKTIYNGTELVYGGANLLYGKKIIAFGDSLQEGGQWLRNLAVMAGITFNTYALGGKQSTPSAAQHSPAYGGFKSMQDFVKQCIDAENSADIFTFENVNDTARCYNEAHIGTLEDKPFMVSQYIEYDNGYTSAASARAGFDSNFATIISGQTFKKGSIINVKYSATSYQIALSGTPVNGSFDLTIGSTTRTIAVSAGQTLAAIATYIATFDFPGYSLSASGSNVVATVQDGTAPNTPTTSNNTSGLTLTITTSSSTSWVFYYFTGLTQEEFVVKDNWSSTMPTLCSVYKGLVEALCSNYPTARIIFFQPIMGGSGTHYYSDGSVDMYATKHDSYQVALSKLFEVQRSICELYNIECVNIYAQSSINNINARLGEWYGSDSIHYLDSAKRRSGEIMYRYLLS